MAINNRSLGSDLQKNVITCSYAADLAHGHSGLFFIVPYNCTIDSMRFSCIEHIDSPYVILKIMRFNIGLGVTTINLTSTFVIPVYGTSGLTPGGITLVSGASNSLVANDVIHYLCEGSSANAKIIGFVGSFVVTPVQDNIKYFGHDN